jgi:hypothetical protein
MASERPSEKAGLCESLLTRRHYFRFFRENEGAQNPKPVGLDRQERIIKARAMLAT